MYIRKTRDVFGLFWNYPGEPVEEIDNTETMSDAKKLKKEYIEAGFHGVTIKKYRVKIQGDPKQ